LQAEPNVAGFTPLVRRQISPVSRNGFAMEIMQSIVKL
jgi:hypothetical protein